MSAPGTALRTFRLARQGCTPRDTALAFLCAGLGSLGRHRIGARRRFESWIGRFAQAEQVRLRLRRPARSLTILMRRGNAADYLVAGELVAGSYPPPADAPGAPTAIVDGGANIGLFTLHASSLFPGVPVTCYEPDTANLRQLELNLAANGIPARIVPQALWSTPGERFYHPAQSYTGYVNDEPSDYPISCVVPEVPAGCWLKLDIEGAEYEVLPALLDSGAQPAWISLEIHAFSTRGQTLLDRLRRHGYEIRGTWQPQDTCITLLAVRQPPPARA